VTRVWRATLKRRPPVGASAQPCHTPIAESTMSGGARWQNLHRPDTEAKVRSNAKVLFQLRIQTHDEPFSLDTCLARS